MKKSAVSRNPTYFDTYINQVDDLELSDAFQQSIAIIDTLDLEKIRLLGDRVYAPGKWTVRDSIQHLIDGERVFTYRALRFARNDSTALPGYDENMFAEYAGASRRPLEDLLAELRCIREGSRLLFESFDEAALRRSGVMFNAEIPVLAIGFAIIGHQNHHLRILEERYFPILELTKSL